MRVERTTADVGFVVRSRRDKSLSKVGEYPRLTSALQHDACVLCPSAVGKGRYDTDRQSSKCVHRFEVLDMSKLLTTRTAINPHFGGGEGISVAQNANGVPFRGTPFKL